MEMIFKNQVVTRQQILDAMQDFDAQHPNSGDFDNWLQKKNYIYKVRNAGYVYPPKHILSMATGIPTTEFSGGEQTNRVFRQLGFEVKEK